MERGAIVITRPVARMPGVLLDVERSTLQLPGRHFPACAVLDPDGDWWGGFVYRTNTGLNAERAALGEWSAFVPIENGALVLIACEANDCNHDLGIDVHLYAPLYDDDRGELIGLYSTGRDIRHWRMGHTNLGMRHPLCWTRCDPEWVVEHIERLARLTLADVHTLGAVPVTLQPIGAAMQDEGDAAPGKDALAHG